MIRIGHGYDVHAFETGKYIILGGVKIAYHKQFKAHSDGDVLIHAVCDALLGALAMGDIGRHFPDTDNAYKGINSRELLRNVAGLMAQAGFKLSNLDITIVAQAPKMSSHIDDMVLHLAADLNANKSQINIKATTTEALGFEGKEQGIGVHSVCLIEQYLT